ncbi:uncharacterized protein At1g66480-like [Diospyros lotus]|uniref:uncharacterized protein At1g66480-like n=1 Tax=Diospyros lotus TaxID=55363 RepID=UPI00224F2D51|nr:uncharacterized protein At1g66480-like [Diospyros lotus]
MGNSLGGRKTAKIMKIDGETFKVKTPAQAMEVTKDFPSHVLLESEAVKHYGFRAKPLEPWRELRPRRLYFLVELPDDKAARRVCSGINMGAMERLESLMLARRSASDLSQVKPPMVMVEEAEAGAGSVRVKVRLSREEVARLVAESQDEAEAVEKIMGLCRAADGGDGSAHRRQLNCKEADGHDGAVKGCLKPRGKRVGFSPVRDTDVRLVAAS